MSEPVEIDAAIPLIFWCSLDLEDCRAIMQRGFLNPEERRLLWRLTRRHGPVPRRLTIQGCKE